MKFIDVSGLGHSGKTAVTDLFREVEGVHAHHNSFEFDLLRLPDGIIDLHQALVEKWSPVRSDMAIKRFKKLCESLNDYYSKLLTDRFMEFTNQYLKSLVIDHLYIDGWYDSLYNKDGYREELKNTLKRIGLFNLVKNGYGLVKSSKNKPSSKTEVFLGDGSGFLEKTIDYLENVIFSGMAENKNTVISNNVFEPFNPSMSLEYFNKAFCVIVDRDPRDIYASVMDIGLQFVPEFEAGEGLFTADYLQQLKEDMLGAGNIHSFINRQIVYRQKMEFNRSDRSIVYIHYEDLVLNYDKTAQLIFDAVGIDSRRHVNKRKHFDPDKSVKNVGVWKAIKDKEEIKLIEKELKEYLYTS
jgi:hypothetical protein